MASRLIRASDDDARRELRWRRVDQLRSVREPSVRPVILRTLRSVYALSAGAFRQGRTPDEGLALALMAAASSREAFRQMMVGIYRKLIPAFAQDTYDDLTGTSRGTRKDAPTDKLFELWLSYADQYVKEKAGTLIVGITNTTMQNVRAAVAAGIAEGESMDKIAARMEDSFAGISRTRSVTIARTETIRASNAASIYGARHSGIALEKEWIATWDDRTRDTHSEANGQRRPLDGLFSIGGYAADHPGDPALPARESVLCRCALGFVPIE